jgi:hypothetical protein
VQKAHFTGLFLAATARLNGYRSEIESRFFSLGERLLVWNIEVRIGAAGAAFAAAIKELRGRIAARQLA